MHHSVIPVKQVFFIFKIVAVCDVGFLKSKKM